MSIANRLSTMVVDDTTVSRALITDALDQLGIKNVVVAKDGQQALNTLMTHPVHLVLSDLNMPGLDGLGLLKALREYKPTSRVGFILVSGSNDQAIIARGRALGLNNFLLKPFTVPAMRSAIEAVVGKL